MSKSPAKTVANGAIRSLGQTLRSPVLGFGILALSLAACGSSEEPFVDNDTNLVDTGSDVAADTVSDTVSDTDVGLCDGPNPAGCSADSDCPTDSFCQAGDEDDCRSSSCSCDPDSGWLCTADCGGGSCTPVGSECNSDAQCAFGEEWCVAGACDTCDNSATFCRLACEEGTSFPDPRNGCVPCECVPDDGCDGPNPAGCAATGCPSGQACVAIDTNECVPSNCSCDESGAWLCTDDCGGASACMIVDSGLCDTNDDCTVGELCVSGQCEALACTDEFDPVCGVDGRTYGNGCEADLAHVAVAYDGECEPDSECGSDEDCAPGQGCFEGVCDFIGCPENWAPVCGVDGITYSNECEADAARVEIAYEGECEPTSGVDCGTAGTCAPNEYCDVGNGGAAGSEPRYACYALPDECVERPTCECVMPDPEPASDCDDGPNGVTISHNYP